MRSRTTRICLVFSVVILGVIAAAHLAQLSRAKADAPAGGDRKLLGTWEDITTGTAVDYTLVSDGTFYIASEPEYWADGNWKYANGTLTLTAKEGSKKVEVGKPMDLPVLYNDEAVLIVKIQQAKGEEEEKDFFDDVPQGEVMAEEEPEKPAIIKLGYEGPEPGPERPLCTLFAVYGFWVFLTSWVPTAIALICLDEGWADACEGTFAFALILGFLAIFAGAFYQISCPAPEHVLTAKILGAINGAIAVTVMVAADAVNTHYIFISRLIVVTVLTLWILLPFLFARLAGLLHRGKA